MFNYLLKGQNNLIASADLELAKDFKRAILELKKTDSLYYKKKLYYEAIFLDLTDRTECHPQTKYEVEDRGGFFEGFVKSFGLGNKKVIWKLDTRFDSEYYFSINWFDSSVEMFLNLKQELTNSKDLYKNGKINFFDYFVKRLQIYNQTQSSKHVQLYKGVNMKKYQDKLRDRLEPILLR